MPTRPARNLRDALTRPGHRGRTVFALAALLAACQPLPHPFEDDKPPAALLHVRDVAGVSIAPIEGEPTATATKLAPAMADSLLNLEIPASDRTTSIGSYQLHGKLVPSRGKKPGETKLTASWRLYAADGTLIGEQTIEITSKSEDWLAGTDSAIEKIADLSAARVASMLEDRAPQQVKEAADGPAGHSRVTIGKITGTTGDGAVSLTNAVGSVLKRQNVTIAESGEKADLTVEAEFEIGPPKAGNRHVKITWHVRRADGSEIGTVGQENDVATKALEGPWGDLSYSIAISAADGLMQLINRGAAPPAKS